MHVPNRIKLAGRMFPAGVYAVAYDLMLKELSKAGFKQIDDSKVSGRIIFKKNRSRVELFNEDWFRMYAEETDADD